ncbi:haloacid dehalogenase [Leucobacter sp. UCD-THU]|jgi:HAD superfamily hydrolase (TIGR01662 family)|uniref:D,D-heptose 1,7-bisphosphate phosphatase n=1 Tax=Leucobacter muris TaxID=1935379 RepID=A0ABX5QGG8_9MICO|nr:MULTISPECIES: HAD family hydrolase [Leucobacter]EYT56336.1 haloacid dehalogenase [Leucobacter sp. UCD-THU]QAB18116.1 HAD-IIIA family hydrolase [Leucobacter muris]
MSSSDAPIAAVFFDRDGTLVEDVPYNAEPERVRSLPTVADTLDELRELGIRVGVISNQSGIGRGLLTSDQVREVDRRVNALLGPFDVWRICPHAPDDGCACRKPQPGMILSAAEQLGIDPSRIVMIGDIGADIEAARAAGARAVLVPTPQTLPEEVAAAPLVARTVREAVALLVPEFAEARA